MTTAKRATPRATPRTAEKKTSTVDQLGEDAEAVATEFPEGTPAFKPYLAIRPRSKRAAFKRKYAEWAKLADALRAKQGVLTEGTVELTPERLEAWADADDLYQVVDDLLRMAAIDPDAYTKWSDEVDDNDLMTTFNVYQRRAQPGEASSSTS